MKRFIKVCELRIQTLNPRWSARAMLKVSKDCRHETLFVRNILSGAKMIITGLLERQMD